MSSLPGAMARWSAIFALSLIFTIAVGLTFVVRTLSGASLAVAEWAAVEIIRLRRTA